MHYLHQERIASSIYSVSNGSKHISASNRSLNTTQSSTMMRNRPGNSYQGRGDNQGRSSISGRGGRDGHGNQDRNSWWSKPKDSPILGVPMLDPRMGPDGTYKFLKCLRRHIQGLRDMVPGIDDIFDEEKPAYPKIDFPEEPEGDNPTAGEMFIWHERTKIALKLETDLTKQKTQIFGIIIQCMSAASIDKVEETVNGTKAMSKKDPKKLVESIKTTHIRTKEDDGQNLYEAKIKFDTSRQGYNESLIAFKNRKSNELNAYRVAAADAESEGDVPSDKLLMQIFIGLMNNQYTTWKFMMQKGMLRDIPESIDEAVQSAIAFGPGSEIRGSSREVLANEKHTESAQILVNNESTKKEFNYRDLECTTCGKKGHCHWHCGRKCEKCGGMNHIGKYCRNPKKSDGEIKSAVKRFNTNNEKKPGSDRKNG